MAEQLVRRSGIYLKNEEAASSQAPRKALKVLIDAQDSKFVALDNLLIKELGWKGGDFVEQRLTDDEGILLKKAKSNHKESGHNE
jgi:hypothetical protein